MRNDATDPPFHPSIPVFPRMIRPSSSLNHSGPQCGVEALQVELFSFCRLVSGLIRGGKGNTQATALCFRSLICSAPDPELGPCLFLGRQGLSSASKVWG